MIKEQKRRQLHYRRATFLKPIGNTLQNLVEFALNKLSPATARFRTIGSEEVEVWKMFINTHRNYLDLQFGNLVLYAPSRVKQTISLDPNADELDVEQIFPPTQDGKDRRFLESVLFYGIKDDHVILMQSMGLRSKDIEEYLNWLLQQAGQLSEDNAVFLNNIPPSEVIAQVEKSPVKSIKLGTPLVQANISDDLQYTPERKTFRFLPWGEGLNVLRAIMPIDRFKDLPIDELESSNGLEITVELSYKRQTDEGSQDMLNRLASSMRNSGDDELRIVLKNGSTIVGSQFQVKGVRTITCYNGLVDPLDVFNVMQGWLLEILEQGRIDA